MRDGGDGEERRRVRFDELPEALAGVIRTSVRNRETAGGMPTLLRALRRAEGGGSADDEVLVLHLAAVDIALQVDGRFNGLVHRIILGNTASVLAGDGAGDGGNPAHDAPRMASGDGPADGDAAARSPGSAADPALETTGAVPALETMVADAAVETTGVPAAEESLRAALRTRLPVYLEWMYDFVSAQLDEGRREPREVLGLEDPTDSAAVIVALGEILSHCHRTLSRWEIVA